MRHRRRGRSLQIFDDLRLMPRLADRSQHVARGAAFGVVVNGKAHVGLVSGCLISGLAIPIVQAFAAALDYLEGMLPKQASFGHELSRIGIYVDFRVVLRTDREIFERRV